MERWWTESVIKLCGLALYPVVPHFPSPPHVIIINVRKLGSVSLFIMCLAMLFNLSRSHLLMVKRGSPTLLNNNSGQHLWDFSLSRPRAQCLTWIISFTSQKSYEECIIIICTLQMSQIMFVTSRFFLSCPLSDLNMGIRAEIVYLCFLDETGNSRYLTWLNLSRKRVKTIGKSCYTIEILSLWTCHWFFMCRIEASYFKNFLCYTLTLFYLKIF